MAKKKTSKKSKKIVINKYKIALILLAICVLFFFTVFMASDGTPLYRVIEFPTHLIIGKYGSFLFFSFTTIMAFYILYDESILKKKIFKKLLLLFIISCAIISFPILESSGSGSLDPYNLGGWTGYIALMIISFLLGHQKEPTQYFTLLIFLGVFIRLLFTLKIKFSAPQIQFDIGDGRNTKKNEIKGKIKEKKSNFLSKKENISKASDIVNDIPKKENKAKLIFKSFFEKKSKDNNENNDINNENDNNIIENKKENIINKNLKQNNNIQETKQNNTQEVKQQKLSFPEDKPSFDINILDDEQDQSQYELDDNYLSEKANSIINKLDEFMIPVSFEGYNIGPTVIQIKIKPEAGIKISRIENLKKDLALGLKTKSLRILAPIPGTEFIGIEIPNPKPQIVALSQILGSKELGNNMSNHLTNLSLGKGIDGNIVIKPLEKMPHLLVAGATGSGKSVGVNDFILSLLFQNSPSELKFIMVDPKQVELGMYEGIPYLLSPIITEPEKAVKILKRAVEFMNSRYQKLKKTKVRNIDQYNQKVPKEEKMYRLVIIIDELADLMMSSNKKDTENYIARIAQMARAVGIHLIVATQRPSVNVITGVIKANIPTRIAFGVVSVVDSRTILDSKGAEDLVGKGDMLYMDTTTKFPMRIQAPFVDTDETENVVSSIKEKYMQGLKEEDIYHPEIINILESKPEYAGGGNGSDGGDDELIEQAIQIITETRKASATMLQRKLGIGFARAARLMDILEERGIVGPVDGAKPREIYV
ncbi:DNA translocase FtsK [Candidatus Vampirococcus lugosii]|uniref:DNA segregation ATPase FtsK/SpoIIIE n=1 Tax=Candidatus Vampirococcus lugosii TaxID=2789015 RepID=A0ABS5QM63_9BACT|nr:DNA segregation ATPase FtsK/SpoIIIE [Candidatus Vampirococcus lugosii]